MMEWGGEDLGRCSCQVCCRGDGILDRMMHASCCREGKGRLRSYGIQDIPGGGHVRRKVAQR